MKSMISNLSHLAEEDIICTGRKSVALGKMLRYGVPVPPGFVLSKDLLELVLRKNNIHGIVDGILAAMNPFDSESARNASEQIKSLISNVYMPREIEEEILSFLFSVNSELFAVRSSAISEDGFEYSSAGRYESFIGVTRENLLEVVKKCWISFFSRRALSSLDANKPSFLNRGMAVIIQAAISGEVSGVSFSADPVNHNQDWLCIEASKTPGAVTSGTENPHIYSFNKKTGEIFYNCFGASGGNGRLDFGDGLLARREVNNLADLVLKIERIFGFPVDVEWIKNGDSFFIVQARKITGANGSGDITASLPAVSLRPYSDIRHLFESEGPFVKYSTFPRTSVVFFQAMSLAYLNNPYIYEFFDYSRPNQVAFMDEFYEAWQNREKRAIIRNKQHALKISSDMLDNISAGKTELAMIMAEVNGCVHDPAVLLKFLKTAHSIAISLYQKLIFFTDECFDLNDRRAIYGLQRVRVKATEFVASFLAPAYRKTIFAIARAREVTPQNIYNFTIDEIAAFIVGSEQPVFDFSDKRSVACMVFQDNFLTLSGNSAIEIKRQLVSQDSEPFLVKEASERRTILGTPVSSGVARGKVLKIHAKDYWNKKIVERLQSAEDFILVSHMARPEIAVHLRRAKAIVTDEGGATCHVAMLAREMGKPCVVGTRIATAILAEGDDVEVDANMGIVRMR